MKELNMAVYTGKDGENKVTLTAAFATHAEAVEFQHELSKICHAANQPKRNSWGRQVIFRHPEDKIYPLKKDDGEGG